MGLHFCFHLNVKYLQVILCGSRKLSLKSKDSGIRVHKGRVCSDGPPQRLIGHAHINNNHTILGRRFPNTYILVRLHGDMGERDELWIDANARKRESLLHGDRSVGRSHGGSDWRGSGKLRRQRDLGGRAPGGVFKSLRRSDAAMKP